MARIPTPGQVARVWLVQCYPPLFSAHCFFLFFSSSLNPRLLSRACWPFLSLLGVVAKVRTGRRDGASGSIHPLVEVFLSSREENSRKMRRNPPTEGRRWAEGGTRMAFGRHVRCCKAGTTKVRLCFRVRLEQRYRNKCGFLAARPLPYALFTCLRQHGFRPEHLQKTALSRVSFLFSCAAVGQGHLRVVGNSA